MQDIPNSKRAAVLCEFPVQKRGSVEEVACEVFGDTGAVATVTEILCAYCLEGGSVDAPELLYKRLRRHRTDEELSRRMSDDIAVAVKKFPAALSL